MTTINNPMRRSAPGYVGIIATVLLLQFALVSWTYPVTALWSDDVQLHIDSAYHWYELTAAVNTAQTGSLTGYDPFFNAGYPLGLLMSGSSARFASALAVIFRHWLSPAVVYKLSSFLAAILGPIFIPMAARRLRLPIWQTIIATVFGFILWWASMFRWFHTAGMVTFVMASFAAVWYLASVIGCLNEPHNKKALVITGILGAVLFFYHPLFPIPIVFGTLLYWAINHRKLNIKETTKAIVVIGTVSIVLSLIWIYPYVHYQRVFVYDSDQPYQREVGLNLISRWTLGLNYGSKLCAVLVLASFWACIGLRSAEERKLAWAFTLTGWSVICFAAFTGGIPGIGGLNPNRFNPTGYLLLVVPAAMGVICMLSQVRQAKHTWLRGLSVVSLMAIAAVTAYSLNDVRRETSYADIGHYGQRPPEVAPLGKYSVWILDWLRRETTAGGRVLFEIPVGRIYDDSNIAGYYAYQSDREFIGGPYPFYFFASYRDGWMFDKPVTAIKAADFQKYLELYNIGWIIAQSDLSKKYLESMPQVAVVDEYRQLRAYKVNRQLNFFIEGKGVVLERGHNKLLLSELEGSNVTLKYHFVPGMKSEPSATLVPVKMMDDPNPFIRIVNPPKKVLLYLQ